MLCFTNTLKDSVSDDLASYVNVAAVQVDALSSFGLWKLTVSQQVYKKQPVTVYT